MATTTMTPEAKSRLSKTIRTLRSRLLTELEDALRSRYKLSIPAAKATLDEATARRRARLEAWVDEQVRALPKPKKAKGKKKTQDDPSQRFWTDIVKEAAYTLLNRLVYLRLLEGHGLRKQLVLTGGKNSAGFRDFQELTPELCRDVNDGYALLLGLVFDELALDLPGLFGRDGLAELVPVPGSVLIEAVDALDKPELESCWGDDMTLGWVYQYWNDPEREALDAKLNDGGKVEPHEIASKTQMFTERYMVDWLLQNSLGPMWLAMCKKHGWTPHCEAQGVLDALEERRVDWRAKRASGEVELTALMPLHSDAERRWAYYLPQPIPDDAVTSAPDSVRDLKILDPAVGSGHFLVVAFDLLVALYREEAEHRGETDEPKWSDRAIVERILSHNLHGIDLDPRAVQIAAAALWLKGQQVSPEAHPTSLGLVAANFKLGSLPDDDPALVELRKAVETDTGIPAALTDQVVHALHGADHLGSLLKVGDVLDRAVREHAMSRAQPDQGSLLGKAFPDEQLRVDVSPEEGKTRLLSRLEQFLAVHTGSADLGLRLRGQQLTAGVRFLRTLQEGAYDLVVGNPPYQGTSKMANPEYVQKEYKKGKADLYAAFLERGLELARQGGTSVLLTMRNWMFIKQYSGLRQWLLESFDLRAVGDFAVGAFDEVPNDVLSVVVSAFRRASPCEAESVAQQPTAPDDTSYDRARTKRKRGATVCHEGRHQFAPGGLKVVPEWPLVYWWTPAFLAEYASRSHFGTRFPARAGMATQDNPRYIRKPWEVSRVVHEPDGWVPLIKGGAGREWLEPLSDIVEWHRSGLQMKVRHDFAYRSVSKYIPSEAFYFRTGVAFCTTGASFSARFFEFPSIFTNVGSTVFAEDSCADIVCQLNRTRARRFLTDLNPSIHFELSDVARLPVIPEPHADLIHGRLSRAFRAHESHRETSLLFRKPGPSAWQSAQAWAQSAVDRPESAALPEYVEELDPEPSSDHLSYALGVALGRFSPDGGILDPETDDLTAALPHGTLFLNGSLADDNLSDSLGNSACELLRSTWEKLLPELDTNRKTLRDWLRLDFFALHKSMYENRPIHWPLSSANKTFVAWINIHRWNATTLRSLLADHLRPTLQQLQGHIEDLKDRMASGDAKTVREADKQHLKAAKYEAELQDFINAVSKCAEQGPPPPDAKTPPREADAPYDPDLDDGVMINSSALWPLLEPQWKDPKKWWKELVLANGRKDYDWSHLAARYFPTRVDEKCQNDPSLAVAHGCFWKYHPERAYAWELRLQDEIGPDFTIDEHGSDAARAAFEADHPDKVKALQDKEDKRREAKRAKAQKQREEAYFTTQLAEGAE